MFHCIDVQTDHSHINRNFLWQAVPSILELDGKWLRNMLLHMDEWVYLFLEYQSPNLAGTQFNSVFSILLNIVQWKELWLGIAD